MCQSNTWAERCCSVGLRNYLDLLGFYKAVTTNMTYFSSFLPDRPACLIKVCLHDYVITARKRTH